MATRTNESARVRALGATIAGRLEELKAGGPWWAATRAEMVRHVKENGIFEYGGKVYSIEYATNSLRVLPAVSHAQLFAAVTSPRLPRVCRVHGELEGSISAETWDQRSELVVTEGREWKGPFPSKRGKRGWD